MSTNQNITKKPKTPSIPIPVRADVFIQPDGSVVFADLAVELVPLALALDPEAGAPPPDEEA